MPLIIALFLFQYGKDFDAITNALIKKQRKRGDPEKHNKKKDQVRHFYYRTWHKIFKYIQFDDGKWYCACVYVTVRVSNQGFSQIPKTFRESVKFLFHSRIRSLNVYGYD